MNNYQQQCAKLAALYKEASETGRPFQNLIKNEWLDSDDPLLLYINMDEVRIKPEKKWRDKLFKGCPVKEIHENGHIEIGYWDSNIDTSSGLDIRLPTLKESPRNVFLVPYDKLPNFKGYRVLFRNTLNNIWDDENITQEEWETVTAFMILGDL